MISDLDTEIVAELVAADEAAMGYWERYPTGLHIWRSAESIRLWNDCDWFENHVSPRQS